MKIGQQPNQKQNGNSTIQQESKLTLTEQCKKNEKSDSPDTLSRTDLISKDDWDNIKKQDLRDILDENEYYHDDLIGLKVYDQNNNMYGTIAALHNFGAGDIIEIKLYNQQNKVMHSFKNAIFPKIDLDNKVITINIS